MNARTVDPHRPVRQDGEQSRERLLRVGLALFAQKGFAKTSTREIAEAAQTNIAAISYYFGDKAGLYRAVFFDMQGTPGDEVAQLSQPGRSLEDSLRVLYASFLEPLRQGELASQCMKLHAREMIEPTGLWDEEISTRIRPMHDGLVGVLCRHFGLRRPDDDIHRLAVCMTGLGVHMHVGRDVMDVIAPTLNTRGSALDTWSERLVMYGLAMAQAETARRAARKAKPALRAATGRTRPTRTTANKAEVAG